MVEGSLKTSPTESTSTCHAGQLTVFSVVTFRRLNTLTNTLVVDFYQTFDVEKLLPQFFALFLLCLIIWHLRCGKTIVI